MKSYLVLVLLLLSLVVSCSSISTYLRAEEARKRETIARLATSQAAEQGTRAEFSASGEDNIILIISDPLYTETSVKILSAPDRLKDFREMGFKQLIVTNGKEQWKVDTN